MTFSFRQGQVIWYKRFVKVVTYLCVQRDELYEIYIQPFVCIIDVDLYF